jgi:sec-independent protein translocase protein TatB
MFDIGWSEMGLILMVALIVIGPKDLPRLARQIGRWSCKARAMAREFQRSLDDMAREAELQDIKTEINKLTRTDLRSEIERTVDPDSSLRRALEPPSRQDFEPKPAAAVTTEPVAVANVTTEPVAVANAGEPPAMPTAPAPALPAAEPAATVTDKA